MIENADFTPPADPLELFREWYSLAQAQEPNDPNAMSLATVGANGMPSVRIVLLKDFDDEGFTFFTNRLSRKGEQLAALPKAALCLHWKSLKRQIRAEGTVHMISDEESEAYFASRPRGSQIGAWASQQSQALVSRAELEQRFEVVEKEFEDKPVPRPGYWGGYRLHPTYLEFWQERLYRLHDRVVYSRDVDDQSVWTDDRVVYSHKDGNKGWTQKRLFP